MITEDLEKKVLGCMIKHILIFYWKDLSQSVLVVFSCRLCLHSRINVVILDKLALKVHAILFLFLLAEKFTDHPPLSYCARYHLRSFKFHIHYSLSVD